MCRARSRNRRPTVAAGDWELLEVDHEAEVMARQEEEAVRPYTPEDRLQQEGLSREEEEEERLLSPEAPPLLNHYREVTRRRQEVLHRRDRRVVVVVQKVSLYQSQCHWRLKTSRAVTNLCVISFILPSCDLVSAYPVHHRLNPNLAANRQTTSSNMIGRSSDKRRLQRDEWPILNSRHP